MSLQSSHAPVGPDPLGNQSISQETESTPLASVRVALIGIGLCQQGVEKMGIESIQKLIPILERGEKHSALVIKMFNAVTESNPGKLARLIDILSVYQGNFSILGQFLDRVGHLDPFLATSRAQLLILPAEGLPTTRGASGHLLKGLTYCAYDSDAPTDTVGYFSKKQAITRIFEAFNPERMTSASQERTRTRRQVKLREELQDLSLSDLEKSPEQAGQTGSHLIVRNMEVYAELRKAIADCKAHLSDLVYGGSIVLSGIKSLKVSEDPGRQFYGWFEEHFKENPNAPRGIRLAFESLRDPDIALSSQDERNYLRGLLSYQRLHSYINKDVALGGLVRDLNEYAQLHSEDALRLDASVDIARHQLQQTAAEHAPEMTIADFGKVLELSGMVQFRQAMNQRVLSIYQNEFTDALKQFEFVSFKDGKWRDDSLGESVPMDRLKRHIYGAKVGVALPDMHESKKQALLGQRDFKHIADAQFLSRLIKDPEKRLSAMPISDFREMVQGVIVAHRKVAHLEAQLAEYRATPSGAALQLNYEDIGEALASWKPTLMIGGKFVPAEVWQQPRHDRNAGSLAIPEIAARLIDRRFDLLYRSGNLQVEFDKRRHEIERVAPAGLYLADMETFWASAEARALPLKPAKDCRNLIDRATQLVANPMIVSTGFDAQKVLAAKYLFSAEISQIENLLTVEETVNDLCRDHRAKLGEMGERLRSSLYQTIYSGGILGERGRLSLRLSGRHFSEYIERIEVANQEQGRIVFYDPEKVEQGLNRLDRDYVSIEAQGREWVEKVKFICSKYGKDLLAKQRLGLVDNETFQAARGLRSNGSDVISRSFVAGISKIVDGQ